MSAEGSGFHSECCPSSRDGAAHTRVALPFSINAEIRLLGDLRFCEVDSRCSALRWCPTGLGKAFCPHQAPQGLGLGLSGALSMPGCVMPQIDGGGLKELEAPHARWALSAPGLQPSGVASGSRGFVRMQGFQ